MRRGIFGLVTGFVCALASGSISNAQGDHLLSVSSLDGFMRTIDPATGATLQSVQIVTSNGVSASNCNGLSYDPLTGQMFGIVREGTATRKLAIINPATAFATIVGTMSDSFAGLAFRSDGVLFGVTGDGANVPETLYTINTANAQATLFMPLGAGTDGETIAFGADGFLYHCSGLSTVIFERINTFGPTLTSIPLSGYGYIEMLSLTLWAGGDLLGMDLNDDVIVLNTSGLATLISTLGAGANPASSIKGLVFAPSPSSQTYLRSYGFGCTSASGKIPLFAGRISGAPGALTANVDLLLGPPNAPGLVAPGSGNGILPVPSFACPIQINPFMLNLIPFTTDAAGRWSVSLGIPSPFPTSDIYLQIALLDGTNLILSSPLQAHFP